MYRYILLLLSILVFAGCQIEDKKHRDVSAVSEKFYAKLKRNDQHGAVKLFSRKTLQQQGAEPLEQYLKRMYVAHGAIVSRVVAGSVEKTSTQLGSASKHVLIQRFNVTYSDGYASQEELSYDLTDRKLSITSYRVMDKGSEWTSAESL
ncbi:MAG: hypothetical protein JNL72_02195 [Flavipsychrobacter sp.]|nr:hypothetical protein [Flavipsychrobacter sp.]